MEKVNGGNQVVPTLLVVPVGGGEGVALTNPSLAQVKAALAA